MNFVESRPQQDELPELLQQLEKDFARILSRYQVPRQDAEDIVQDLVVLFLSKRAEIHTPGAWLTGTLRLRCLLYWRKRRSRLLDSMDEALLDLIADPKGPRQDRDDIQRDLSGAIRQLPERCRSFIRLRYGLDCDVPDVAKRLGYSPTGIRKIAARCLSALSGRILSAQRPLEVTK